MPPKATSLESKIDALHQHLLKSGTCFTLKELEAKPPGGAAKIRGADVKALLKSLTDEGQVKCEKIGAGNWYWAAWSNQTAEKQKTIQGLIADKTKRESSVSTMQKEVSRQEKLLPCSEGLFERVASLQAQLRESQAHHSTLQKQFTRIHGQDSLLSMEEKQKEMTQLACTIERWEDNVELVKGYILKLSGGDRSVLDQVLRSLAGDVGNEDEENSDEPNAKKLKIA